MGSKFRCLWKDHRWLALHSDQDVFFLCSYFPVGCVRSPASKEAGPSAEVALPTKTKTFPKLSLFFKNRATRKTDSGDLINWISVSALVISVIKDVWNDLGRVVIIRCVLGKRHLPRLFDGVRKGRLVRRIAQPETVYSFFLLLAERRENFTASLCIIPNALPSIELLVLTLKSNIRSPRTALCTRKEFCLCITVGDVYKILMSFVFRYTGAHLSSNEFKFI